MLDNIIPFPVLAEPELEESDWGYLIEQLDRAHRIHGEK